MITSVSQMEWEDSFDIQISNTAEQVTVNIGNENHTFQGNSYTTSVKIKTFPCAKSSICIPYSSFNETFKGIETDHIDYQLRSFVAIFNVEWYKLDEVFMDNGQSIKLLHGFIDKDFNEPITIKQSTPTSQVNVYFLHNLFVPLSSLLHSDFNRQDPDIANLMIWYKYIKNIFRNRFKENEQLHMLVTNYERVLFDETG